MPGRRQAVKSKSTQPVVPLLKWVNVGEETARKRLAGWVARTRPLAEPLSPRGPQPVLNKLQTRPVRLNGPADPPAAVPTS